MSNLPNFIPNPNPYPFNVLNPNNINQYPQNYNQN